MHALAEESKNHIKDIHEKYMSRADEIRKELTEKHREEVSQFYSDQICWEKMPQGAEKKCCWNDSTNFGLILICFNSDFVSLHYFTFTGICAIFMPRPFDSSGGQK